MLLTGVEPPKITSDRPNPGGQLDFSNDWLHRFIAAEGGWGSGKTWIGARKFLTLHIINASDDNGDPTFVPSAMLGPTYRNIYDIDIPALEDACDDANIKMVVKSTASEVVLPDLGTRKKPSRIMIRSADKPEIITGWEIGSFWGDEPTRFKEDRVNPKRDPYIQILGRLRHPAAKFLQGMWTYTNEGDATRIYEEFSSGKPDYALYRLPTTENPVMHAFEEAQRRVLTPEMARQYLDGEAISLRGQNAYSTYDPKSNERRGLKPVAGIPLAVFIDFNIDPGMYFGIGQHHGSQDMLCALREIYQPRLDVRRGVAMLAATIGEFGGLAQFGGTIDVFGDATGRSSWVGTSESAYQILRQCLDKEKIPYRMRVPQSNPSVFDRINAVNVGLLDVEGHPHITIEPDGCPRLRRDFMKVRYDSAGKDLDKTNPELTHSSDAVSYWVHYVRPARVRSVSTPGRFGVAVG